MAARDMRDTYQINLYFRASNYETGAVTQPGLPPSGAAVRLIHRRQREFGALVSEADRQPREKQERQYY
jgi:hypothetical protein